MALTLIVGTVGIVLFIGGIIILSSYLFEDEKVVGKVFLVMGATFLIGGSILEFNRYYFPIKYTIVEYNTERLDVPAAKFIFDEVTYIREYHVQHHFWDNRQDGIFAVDIGTKYRTKVILNKYTYKDYLEVPQ